MKIKIKSFQNTILRLILKIDYEKLVSRDIIKKYYNITIGKHSYGCFKVDGSIEPNTIIGSFCSIAPGVIIGGMNHPIHFISTHPFLYSKRYRFAEETNEKVLKDGTKQIIIEDDVWIGRNAIILPGVTIGKGAVIGAGSVVTKDVPPYCVVGGVPANVIKKRFSEEEIEKLMKICWTEWNDERLKSELMYFYNIDIFLDKYYKDKTD